jgi:carbamoylphosphate synthase large subunit
MRVAVTGVGGGVGQAVIQALRGSSLEVWLLGLDASPWSAGLYQCDAAAVVPPARDQEAYVGSLEALVEEHGIEALIPGTDPELLPLALARDRLAQRGCRVIVSAPAAVRTARDKLASYQFLSSRGLPFARTTLAPDFASRCSPASFPAFLKPRGGSASVGGRLLFSPADVPDGLTDAEVVQEYLLPCAWGVAELRREEAMKQGRLRQEDEVSVQACTGPEGDVVSLFAGITEYRDGVVMRVAPTRDQGILALAERTFRALGALGLAGPCNVQGRVTARGLVFYEINPRFTGGSGARAALGFNECEAALRLFLLEEERASVAARLRYSEGAVCFRYMTDEVAPRAAIERLDRAAPVTPRSSSPDLRRTGLPSPRTRSPGSHSTRR